MAKTMTDSEKQNSGESSGAGESDEILTAEIENFRKLLIQVRRIFELGRNTLRNKMFFFLISLNCINNVIDMVVFQTPTLL
jgi:hypothetical protein